jgi:hypothetical protein
MTLTVQPVDANYISQVWPLVEKYLSDALVEGAEKEGIDLCYNIHHAQAFLTNGTWLLLVAVDEQNRYTWGCGGVFYKLPLT